MKPLPVKISRRQREAIREQVRYIARHSVDNALAWEDRIRVAIDGLGRFHNHAIDEEASDRMGQPRRKLVIENTYLIHYRILPAAIQVVGFRHGARLPRDGEP